MPISKWLHYGDHALARLWRSRGGSITPIRHWLQYADHLVAPMCRSVTTVRALGGRAVFRRLDVRDKEDWSRVTAEAVSSHGRLDVLVNNAGITGVESGLVAHDPENATLEGWRRVHRTNLDGVFLGCKYAIRAMRPNKSGSIINISSRSGLVGIPAAAAYASSKAAVRNHTKSVALWCAQQNLAIRCNSIHPAAIPTPMWEPMLGSGAGRETRMAALVKDTPLHRFGTPEEVAALATYGFRRGHLHYGNRAQH